MTYILNILYIFNIYLEHILNFTLSWMITTNTKIKIKAGYTTILKVETNKEILSCPRGIFYLSTVGRTVPKITSRQRGKPWILAKVVFWVENATWGCYRAKRTTQLKAEGKERKTKTDLGETQEMAKYTLKIFNNHPQHALFLNFQDMLLLTTTTTKKHN